MGGDGPVLKRIVADLLCIEASAALVLRCAVFAPGEVSGGDRRIPPASDDSKWQEFLTSRRTYFKTRTCADLSPLRPPLFGRSGHRLLSHIWFVAPCQPGHSSLPLRWRTMGGRHG